jgi:recombination endonuclease VII
MESFPPAKRQANGRGAYCRPCYNRIINENRAAKHGSSRNYHLRHRYGIGVEDFDRMLAEQGGLCAICREAPAEHVDHDHRTKRVRGLLCFNCNGALGQFRDRRDLMLRAIAYLDHDTDSSLTALPSFRFCVAIGGDDDPRPADEPALA